MTVRERTQRRLRRAAFTLMEMLVVVAIIVALAGIGGYYFLGASSQAKVSTARAQLRTLTDAAKTYALHHNEQFPPALESLLERDGFGGPYLERQDALIDPWGQPYQYDPTGQRNGGFVADIWTVGPDGTEIGNWQSARQGASGGTQ